MGSTRLKLKDRVNYRRAHKGETHCDECVQYRLKQIMGIGGDDLGLQERCTFFGYGASRKYRISMDHTCDVAVPREWTGEEHRAKEISDERTTEHNDGGGQDSSRCSVRVR